MKEDVLFVIIFRGRLIPNSNLSNPRKRLKMSKPPSFYNYSGKTEEQVQKYISEKAFLALARTSRSNPPKHIVKAMNKLINEEAVLVALTASKKQSIINLKLDKKININLSVFKKLTKEGK
jgi:hypothetical protein